MEKTEKMLILGKSGSGKDFLMRKLVKKNLKPGLKWTTRPQRKNEENGITYNFVDEQTFLNNIDNFLCYQKFEVTPLEKEKETWYYGLTKEEFENGQLFIFTPEEFLKINEEERKNCFVVFLDIPDDIRESRIIKREDNNDSVKRRLDSDAKDFENFNDYDLRITDPDFTADDIYDLMF